MTPIEVKPVPARLSWWRWLLSSLPGHCSYCGRRYRPAAVSGSFSVFAPLGATGRCCPDGHEGYADQFVLGVGHSRQWADNVKYPPPGAEAAADPPADATAPTQARAGLLTNSEKVLLCLIAALIGVFLMYHGLVESQLRALKRGDLVVEDGKFVLKPSLRPKESP